MSAKIYENPLKSPFLWTITPRHPKNHHNMHHPDNWIGVFTLYLLCVSILCPFLVGAETLMIQTDPHKCVEIPIKSIRIPFSFPSKTEKIHEQIVEKSLMFHVPPRIFMALHPMSQAAPQPRWKTGGSSRKKPQETFTRRMSLPCTVASGRSSGCE